MTTRTWVRSAESWQTTARRTGFLALIIGIGVGIPEHRLILIPEVALLALWFTLGGHFVELLFRNTLRQQLSANTVVQALARIVWWFVCGSLLYECALGTRALLGVELSMPWPWWIGGIAFTGVELAIHMLINARGQPNFYDGRG